MTYEYNSAMGTSFNYFAYSFAPHLIKKEEKVEEINLSSYEQNSNGSKRLQLTTNNVCLGKSIAIYSNSISKFFAQLFNKGQYLTLNNETYFVNKKSFVKHITMINKDYIHSENNSTFNYNKYFENHKTEIMDTFINKK